MRITRFDPLTDTVSVRACLEIVTECDAADDPAAMPWTFRTFSTWCAVGWTGEPKQVWLASDDDGEPAGLGMLELPDRDNLDRAFLLLWVGPGRRRAGTGTALLRHCAEQARAAGRVVLDGGALADPDSAGSGFARAIGARPGLLDIRRELRVDAGLAARLAPLSAEATRKRTGYSLLDWTGPVPEPLLDQMARVIAAIEDAPRDAGREAEVWDAERVRIGDQIAERLGERHYTVVARHDASNELAAMTALHVNPELPELGFQELTAVAREHRGHRLGLATKVAMLELIAEREPAVQRIFTFNAADNKHMIAINEALGFQVNGEFRSFEIDVSEICGPSASDW